MGHLQKIANQAVKSVRRFCGELSVRLALTALRNWIKVFANAQPVWLEALTMHYAAHNTAQHAHPINSRSRQPATLAQKLSLCLPKLRHVSASEM